MFFTYSTSIFTLSSHFSHSSFDLLLFRLFFLCFFALPQDVFFCEFCAWKRGSGVLTILLWYVALPPPDLTFSATQCHSANPCSSFCLSLHSLPLPTFFCRLPTIFVLIHPLKSSGGYFLSFGIDFASVRFAFSSAYLFPVIPAFPGNISSSIINELPHFSGLWIFHVIVSGCGHHGS
jgi:hypothetical protein